LQIQTEAVAGASEGWISHLGFSVKPREFGSVQLAFITDPAGMWIELVEPPGQVIPKATVQDSLG